MKAIAEKVTGKVYYLLSDDKFQSLTTSGLVAEKMTAHDISSDTHEVIDIDAPDVWIGGGVLNIVGGVWGIADQTVYDAYIDGKKDAEYDADIKLNKIVKALILALNDGTFVPGSNYTAEQIKNGIKNRM